MTSIISNNKPNDELSLSAVVCLAFRFAETMADPVNDDTGVTSQTIISRTDQLLGMPPSFIDNTENTEAMNANVVKAIDQVKMP